MIGSVCAVNAVVAGSGIKKDALLRIPVIRVPILKILISIYVTFAASVLTYVPGKLANLKMM
jgi:hypothetical protein